MPSKPELLDQVRDKIRIKHYSLRTEDAYVQWIKRFIFFHGKRHPRVMSAPEVEAFLSHLATDGRSYVTDSVVTPGMRVVSRQRSTPSFEVGSHKRLNTITRNSAWTGIWDVSAGTGAPGSPASTHTTGELRPRYRRGRGRIRARIRRLPKNFGRWPEYHR